MLTAFHPREKAKRGQNRAVMATAAALPSYPHIVTTPGVRGGKACIDGTRIAVIDVVCASQEGHSPEAIQTLFSSRPLTLAEVYAALAYFHDNRQEIEALFEAEDRLFERLDREWEEHVARHGGVPPEKPSPEERAIARPVYWSPKR